jgi:hypothetical protein
VQLLAAHLAWVCDINVGSDDSAALIRECHLRSKTRLNES